jgi:hypothetical protein
LKPSPFQQRFHDPPKAGKSLSSLRLTVVPLAFSMVLIFVATISQVYPGIHEVQLQFFR